MFGIDSTNSAGPNSAGAEDLSDRVKAPVLTTPVEPESKVSLQTVLVRVSAYNQALILH